MSYVIYTLWVVTFWKPLYWLIRWVLAIRKDSDEVVGWADLIKKWFKDYWSLVSWHVE